MHDFLNRTVGGKWIRNKQKTKNLTFSMFEKHVFHRKHQNAKNLLSILPNRINFAGMISFTFFLFRLRSTWKFHSQGLIFIPHLLPRFRVTLHQHHTASRFNPQSLQKPKMSRSLSFYLRAVESFLFSLLSLSETLLSPLVIQNYLYKQLVKVKTMGRMLKFFDRPFSSRNSSR